MEANGEARISENEWTEDGSRSRNSLLFSYKGGPYATMVVLKRENTSEITDFIEYHAPPEKKKKDR